MDFPANILSRARTVRLVIFDVDGVLTDGRLYYGDDGHEMKAFHVHDGSAIKMLLSHGVEVAIITGRESLSVSKRATELGVQHLYQDVADKVVALRDLSQASNVSPGEMAHVGDDLPDIGLFAEVGLAIAVPNGHSAAQQAAGYITRARGGEGVASEVCQLILTAQGKWPYGAT
jgi:3-deoxy-D-manno-octulosonate 8-phosphate phosphatase (KDO 8-P phosphatase)